MQLYLINAELHSYIFNQFLIPGGGEIVVKYKFTIFIYVIKKYTKCSPQYVKTNRLEVA